MFTTRRATAPAVAAAVAVAVLLTAACGGDGDPQPPPPTASTTEPALTAPPALTPEEQAAADIEATFEQLIAAWDDFKASASDYGDDAAADPAWNFALVELKMRMLDDAQIAFLNSTNAFLSSEIEQVGQTVVAALDVRSIELSDGGSASAQGYACLDLSGLTFVNYSGASADLPTEPSAYQEWTFVSRLLPGRDGWFMTMIDIEVTEACQ
ncbi:hypothetical protein [Jiangella endophytica]|uniref:hypothetical protein n=1 Tax=Jiangella endophytica TaxID=1623398 RepID=UPI00130026F5|nr:hypothetical protein [Jiangella endophytica]